MTEEMRRELLALGLRQIPADGLERLRDWLADPDKPVLLTGEVYAPDAGG